MEYIETEEGSYTHQGMIIPAIKGSRHYDKMLRQVDAGEATVEAWSGSARELEDVRAYKIAAIKSEGLKRIQSKVDAINSIAIAKLIYKHMWPQPSPSQSLLDGESIYNYAVTKITQARTATRAQLDNYDPVTDNGWPS